MSLDEHDLAAKRLLGRLVDEGAIAFVSSRGAAALAPAAANLLLRIREESRCAERFAEWLMEQVEVADLYVEDDVLEQVLVAEWDRGEPRRGGIVARNGELEARLLAEPDAIEPRLVYGDWLQAQGDPFGDWMARSVAAERPGAAPALAREAGAYFETHAASLLGRLAEYLGLAVHLDWQLGFVHRARLARHPSGDESYEGAILLRWLLEHRAALLLRELELESLQLGRSLQLQEMVDELLARPPRLLRRLQLGQGEGVELGGLLAGLPELLELAVDCERLQLPPLEHARLNDLTINLGWSASSSTAFVQSRLPALESLSLLGSRELDDEQLRELTSAARFPALRCLRVRGAAGLLARLASSSLLARLEILDLSGGDLDDDSVASTLVAQRERFSHLRRLVLDDNRIGSVGARQVVDALGSLEVVIGTQRPPLEYDEDDDSYEDSME